VAAGGTTGDPPRVDGTPRIRRARASDWPAARGLLQEGDDLHARIAPRYFRAGPRPETEWRRLLDEPTGIVFVAEVRPSPSEPQVVGLVALRIYDTPQDPTMVARRRGHVETLVVSSGHRRRGIGRRLMDEAATWARLNGAVELVLTAWDGNKEAEAFYGGLGYRTLSRVLSTSLV
jgi:ribosomal protein S18 acetylase RimI-like enzyme